MGSLLGTMLAAAAATAGVAGCAEAPPAIGPGVDRALAASEIATVGAPGLPDIPFGEALVTFSHALGDLHAAGEQVDARIRREIFALAIILERMPAGSAQPSLRRAAGLIRAADEDAPSIENMRRSLAVAASALLPLAQTLYRAHPEILDRARAFAGAVAMIDPASEPPDRAGVIHALLRAERVLAAMYAANVTPPHP